MPPALRVPLAVATLAVALLAVGMARGSHFDSDDTLYAQMAREMVASGDLVDNRWSGEVVFEKPPLYLWTLAASGATLGWGEGAMRLPGTLFAAFALAALALLVTSLGGSPGQAVAACALLGASTLFLLLTRRLMMDVPLVACELGAAAALARRSATGFGALSGLAVLVKGPAAAPVLLALAIFALLERHFTWRRLGQSALVGLAVAAPWFLIATLRHGGELWRAMIGYHVLGRASQAVVPTQPFADLLVDFAARDVLLVTAGAVGLGVAVARKLQGALPRLGALWLVAALLPVAVSTTRLAHYLLPALPALCLLAVAAVPARVWASRVAAPAAVAVALAALLLRPLSVDLWLAPDLGPHEKALGLAIAAEAEPDDLVATYDVTSSALTFYAARRFEVLAEDPRFFEVMDAVDMVRRSGVLHWLDGPGFPPALGARRFVVARGGADLAPLLARMRRAEPRRPLFTTRQGDLVLVDDAGVGAPLP